MWNSHGLGTSRELWKNNHDLVIESQKAHRCSWNPQFCLYKWCDFWKLGKKQVEQSSQQGRDRKYVTLEIYQLTYTFTETGPDYVDILFKSHPNALDNIDFPADLTTCPLHRHVSKLKPTFPSTLLLLRLLLSHPCCTQ